MLNAVKSPEFIHFIDKIGRNELVEYVLVDLESIDKTQILILTDLNLLYSIYQKQSITIQKKLNYLQCNLDCMNCSETIKKKLQCNGCNFEEKIAFFFNEGQNQTVMND